MSLLVWLPLNGNLKNKGCADVSISVSGTTSYTDGKIGQALSCNGSTFWNISSITLGSSASIAYWSKTSTNNKMVWVLESVASNKLNIYESDKYTLNTGDSTANPYRDTTNSDIACLHDNLWHHFVITFGSNESLLYIDGNYAGKALTFRNPTTTNGKIKLAGGYNNAHSYDWNGQINDFRVYDHCLSVAEIKEISRGLVLHYPLNRIATKNWIPFSLNSDNYTISDYSSRTSGSIINKVYHVTGYQSDTSADTSFSITSKNFITLTSNTDYYLRFYCKSKSDGDLYFGTSDAGTRLEDSSSQYVYPSTTFMLGKEYNDYVVLKLHTGTDTQYKLRLGFDVPNIYGVGSYIEFSEVTLSTIESDWFTFDGQDIVNDCSGYDHHGTCSGALATINDSPRYTTSVVFNGSSCINAGRGAMVKDAISVCCWGYMDSWSGYNKRMMSCTEAGGWNFESLSGKLNFACGTGVSSNTYKSITSTTTLSSLSAGWHHFVGTYDGFNTKVYIDGVLEGTLAAYTTKTPLYYNRTNSIFVGAEAGSSATTPVSTVYFTGRISDVRIYATALSADDVLQLYNIGAKIDNMKNLHCYEIQEYDTTGTTKLLKTGVFKAVEFNEVDNSMEIKEDGNVDSNKIIEI